MLTSLILAVQFFLGIGKRLASDAYYRSLGILVLIVLVIGTIFTWMAGKWSFISALLYSVTTMSMNTFYNDPHVEGAGKVMVFFHMVYTFLSVGVFIIFTLETGKTMIATYEGFMKKMADRKAKKAARKAEKNAGA